ncbi:MAG: amidohydrolase family protein [Candidatus Eremiobacter antarcticus]|nr:amidohydrolase family protein [Candidatus Eremiobacteraeota bacterium]MBC5807337.1 amidohydrolase family protein [Candidatus Eremiobacteraeota bacterium]
MSIVLRGGRLIDATGADPAPAASILIEDQLISKVSSSSTFRNHDAQVIDCEGLTLLPGLIDAHAHLGLVYDFAAEGDPGLVSPAEIAAWTFENCRLCLEAGFTTVRDMSGVDGGLVRAIESGAVAGPRVFPSGAAIVQTGGHGNISGPFCHQDTVLSLPGLVQMIAICDGPDEVTRQARLNFRRGATQLKAFISGGVVSTTDRLEDTQLTVEELKAAVWEAKARDTYVAGHAHNVNAIRNGLEAGLECFEHGTMLDEPTADAMAEAGAALDPTLAVCHLMAQEWKKWGLPEAVVPRVAGCESAMARSIKLAEKAGVLIGSGSDLLGRRQDRRGLELALKARILSPMRAIECATIGNARIMRQDRLLGTVEAGKLADIVAFDRDPLADPDIFDDPARAVLVIKGGAVVKNLVAEALVPA